MRALSSSVRSRQNTKLSFFPFSLPPQPRAPSPQMSSTEGAEVATARVSLGATVRAGEDLGMKLCLFFWKRRGRLSLRPFTFTPFSRLLCSPAASPCTSPTA
jgi:hypothetical protein